MRTQFQMILVLLAAVAGSAAPAPFNAAHAEPVKIRAGWLLVPAEITPIMFPQPGIGRHNGTPYVLDPPRYQGTTPPTSALAAGELHAPPFAYPSFPPAIE